jgi:hypothetical protein
MTAGRTDSHNQSPAQAASELNESLKTCHKLVDTYRTMLRRKRELPKKGS